MISFGTAWDKGGHCSVEGWTWVLARESWVGTRTGGGDGGAAADGSDLSELEGAVYLQSIMPRSVQRPQTGWAPLHLTFAARQASQAVGGRRTSGFAPLPRENCQLRMYS